MKKLTLLIALLLAGCAASQEDLNSVAQIEAARLVKPSKPFSEFAAYELKDMVLSADVGAKPDKVEQAAVLEGKIREKLLPLFAEWSSLDESGRSGTLIVQPELVQLRIVSGGARFFAGAFAGDSLIDMDLKIIDGATNSEVARPRISKKASAMGGAWSVGKTDTNLHDYIAHITHRYMVYNY